MSAIFLSHSSKDNDVAIEVRSELEQRGHRSVFLDFDPADGIPAGREWEKELYARLRACRAVIVLCSEHSMSSDWCFAEITHARSLGKHVFPLIVAPCALRHPLTETQSIDLTKDREDAYQRLERGLVAAGLDPKNMFDWDGSRPPYPGLSAFQESDAAIYFGRDAEIQQGLDTLNRLQRFGGARLALVLGASGSGKSSLMRAGIVPRLHRDADRWIVVDVFRPLQDPVREFALALNDTFTRYEAPRDWRELRDLLSHAASRGDEGVLIELAEELRIAAGQRGATVLLVVDQLEELLGYIHGGRGNEFLTFVQAALETPNSPLMVAGTLRSDFLGDFQTHPKLQKLTFENVSIGPLSADGFAQVIESPAALCGLDLEAGLVQAMVDDTATDDALPLLAFTLRELYERYGGDGRLQVQEYRDLGGLDGSVARAAEAVMAAQRLSQAEQDDLRGAFVAMVRINEDGHYTRRAVLWEDLPQASHGILERFVSARLLVSRSDDQGLSLEVAHESLFRAWQQLATWLDEDRDNIRLRDGIHRAAVEWDAAGREEHLLVHREARLEAAEMLARQPRFEVDAVARDYIQAGVDLRDAAREAEALRQRREIEAARRLARRTFGAALITGVFAVAAAVFGYVAYEKRLDAIRQLAKTHWVNGVTARDRDGLPLRASHHLMKAAELEEPLRAANAYLAAGLLVRGVRLRHILENEKNGGAVLAGDGRGILTWSGTKARLFNFESAQTSATIEHEDTVRSAALSDEGDRVLTASDDRTSKVSDRASGQSIATMSHGDRVSGAVFHPDQRRVLSWSYDGTARIWNIEGEQAPLTLSHQERVYGARFDHTGRQVLTWSKDKTARVWDSQSGDTRATVEHGGPVLGGLFNEDASRVVTWSDDKTARVWRSQGGRPLAIVNHDGAVRGAIVDRKERWILTWSDDKTARVSDIESGDSLAVLKHQGFVRGASFNNEASRVLTWSDDRTARVWDTQSGDLRVEVKHAGPVLGAILDAQERWLLTWSDDRSARVWDARNGQALTPPLMHQGSVKRAFFGASGTRITTQSQDGITRIWKFSPTQPVVTARQRFSVLAAQLSRNEREIMTWNADGVVQMFDGYTGESQSSPRRLASPDGHQQPFNGARFSSDGSSILTWSQDGTARLWDRESAKPKSQPLKHEESPRGVLGGSYGPNGRRVLTWSDGGTVRTWDSGNGSPVAELEHDSSVRGAVFNPEGHRVLSWDFDGRAVFWDSDNSATHTKVDDSVSVSGALFTPDGRRALAWAGGRAQYLDPSSGKSLSTLFDDRDITVKGAVFSRDGTRLLSWSSGSARIRDSEDGTSLVHLPQTSVRGGVFTRDGRRALTWSRSSLRLWNSDNGQPLTGLMGHSGQVEGARFSTDEQRILTWSADGTARLWSLELDRSQPGRAVHALEVRTGTRLDDSGELKVLSPDEWRNKQREHD